MLPNLRKAFKVTLWAYGLSLPLAFLVGGAWYSRPMRSPVPAKALAENMQPDWDTGFLRGSREIRIPISSRVRLAANLFGTDTRVAVIVLHPSGGTRLDALPVAYSLWRHGLGVVLLDRRAHGSSEGETQPLFLEEEDDLSTAVSWLIAENLMGTAGIGVVGIGDAATSALLLAAHDPRIDAVAAIEPVTDANSYVSRQLSRWTGLPRPAVTAQAVVAVRAMLLFSGAESSAIDARPAFAKIDAPVWISGGRDDLSRSDAQAVAAALRAAKVELIQRDADADGYDGLASFFQRQL